jgi:2-oxoglutarate ferredoxin oxidoreductase subunit alpha
VTESDGSERDEIVNDLQLSIASMNGDMSTSTNDAFTRSLFRMGVPVSSKRFFPSNIKGDPTRYLIRVSEDGFQSFKDVIDWTVVLFEDNAAEDIQRVRSDGVCMFDPSSNLGEQIKTDLEEENEASDYYRDDLVYYQVPFEELAEENYEGTRLRKIMHNVIYVGALMGLLDVEMDHIAGIIRENFAAKGQKIVDSNLKAVEIGMEYVKENIEKRDPYRLEERDLNDDKRFMDGNDASALGAVMGGCSYASWYPITPASSHGENLEKFSEAYPLIVEQGENEDSCIGRAIGASWAGARSSASTSGPGISNMAEFIGYSSFTEIPVVIFDMQRVGPSTGLPTHTKQGDIRSLMHISHDEAPRMVLTPSTIEEIYEYSVDAFDLAAQYQMPVFVMSELGLAMCNFTVDKPEYPDEDIEMGKVLTDEELSDLDDYKRYEDVDGDGICPRTVPGQDAMYVTRGAGHAPDATLTEDPDLYASNMERLFQKLDTALEEGDLPSPTYYGDEGAEVGIIGFGSSYYTIEEAMFQLQKQGVDVRYMDNSTVIPLHTEEIESFLEDHSPVYVVEQNYTGQFMNLLRQEIGHQYDMRPLRKYDGDFMRPMEISEKVLGDLT